jgi:acetyl-CoA acetyltransferase
VASGHRVLEALVLTGVPIVDVEAGCASGAAALALGAASIRSGQHEAVLVVGVEKMPKGIIRSSFFAPWQGRRACPPIPPTSPCAPSGCCVTRGSASTTWRRWW